MMMMIYNCDDSDGNGADGNTYHLYFMHLIEKNRKGHHFNMFSTLNANRSKLQYRDIRHHGLRKLVEEKDSEADKLLHNDDDSTDLKYPFKRGDSKEGCLAKF